MRRDNENVSQPLVIAVPDNPYVYVVFIPGTQQNEGGFRLQYKSTNDGKLYSYK